MEETEFEKRLEELLAQDFSDGTESFRDELLARCLAELTTAEDASTLDDADLEMLAAAGDLAVALA